VTRDEVESGLQFLGFLIMQNKLKPVTSGVIEQLNHANIRTIMATGDNVLTAISVGRECKIIDPHSEVFLGEVRTFNGIDKVFWKSTKNANRSLNEQSLDLIDENGRQVQDKHESNRGDIERREQNEQSINDIVDIAEEDDPWLHPPERYSIALTGKAFDILLNDPKNEHILQRVLLKA
jgi:magnesium-transporting ATPase (P-type)